MGLDMYLTRHYSFYNANMKNIELTDKNNKPIQLNGINLKNVQSFDEEIGYWRKANQIHKWFVDNVQNGQDDCGSYYVSAEKLQELLNLCRRILKNKSIDLANKHLPPQRGFFFGGTELDEYYFEDLKQTVKILNNVLKSDKKLSEIKEGGIICEIFYNSSW